MRVDGRPVRDRGTLNRIADLRIPPAWKDVWICLDPRGHLQATGLDAAGRKQYLYHSDWRDRRDQQKFDEMTDFAAALPRLRRRVTRDLARDGACRERVLACAVRLLDLGFFRVGSERYAEENRTFGLATMRRRHLKLGRDRATFDYRAKGGQRIVQQISGPEVMPVLRLLKRRRGGGDQLLAFKQRGRWSDLNSADINQYLKEASGGDFSAKDFRTWNATVLAAVTLAAVGDEAETRAARKRAASQAISRVADYLGNTPAVCRASYVDPRVIDRFNAGVHLGSQIERILDAGDPSEFADRAAIERAVLELLA